MAQFTHSLNSSLDRSRDATGPDSKTIVNSKMAEKVATQACGRSLTEMNAKMLEFISR